MTTRQFYNPIPKSLTLADRARRGGGMADVRGSDSVEMRCECGLYAKAAFMRQPVLARSVKEARGNH
jgi:hypothetical protein